MNPLVQALETRFDAMAPELLATPPVIEKIEVLAAKLPS